jgi:predicted ATPase
MLTFAFRQTSKSIGALTNPPELERFSIITGVNGSGKTHLLEAIINSKVLIAIDGVPVPVSDIRSFSWQTLDVGQTGPVDVSTRVAYMSQFWASVQQIKQNHLEPLRAQLLSLGANVDVASTETLFVTAGEEPYQDNDMVRNILAQVNQQIQSQLQGQTVVTNPWTNRIDMETLTPAHPGLASLSQIQFRNKLIHSPIMLDPFRQQLSALFAAYRKAQETNAVNRVVTLRSAEPLDDLQFIDEYGRAPWDLLNEMLDAGGYRFRVSQPEDSGPFEAEIRSTDSSATWNFNDLSSGEKVLISFLLASYTIHNGFVNKQVPKVLLLDEVDAPLHPSMIDGLLRVVSEILVEGQGVYCIMTTHNPATIALANSASIYKMSPDEPRLSTCTQEEAIQILSVGLPTLRVAVENRRVVWVESDYDVTSMELITAALKKQIMGPFVPIFQSVGFKAIEGQKDSEQSGGKKRVKDVVKALTDAGMPNVRGLVDSDGIGNATSESGIVRLTDGERYSIENVLLDPLLIGVLIIRERLDCAGLSRASFGLSEQETWGGLDSSNSTQLQGIVDKVLGVLGLPEGTRSDGTKKKVTLLNETAIEIPTWFLEVRGHDWSKHLLTKLQCLNKWKSESGLMSAIARTVVADAPELLPKAVLDSIQSLCEV